MPIRAMQCQMHTFKLFIHLAWMALTLSACVLLPIPTQDHKVLAGTPVSDELLTFIAIKETTKNEVIARLGAPQIIWEDARLYVYEWDVRQGVLLWLAGWGYSGFFGAEDIPEHCLILIQFDDTDRVQRFERATRRGWKSHEDFLREWVNPPRLDFPAQGIQGAGPTESSAATSR